MSVFKKLTALILALVMALMLFACDTEEIPNGGDQSEIGGENGGETGDGGKETLITVPDTLATQFINSVFAKVESAKTVKLSYTFNTSSSTETPKDFAGNTSENLKAMSESAAARIDITAARTELGLDLKLELTEGNETKAVYLIDGIGYQYDEEVGAYVAAPLPSPEEILGEDGMAAIGEMMALLFPEGIPEIGEPEIEAIKAQIAIALKSLCKVDANGNLVYTLDFKDALQSVINYIGAIDPEKDTLETILNDLISKCGENMTVEELLAELLPLGEATVGDIYYAIQAIAEENLGMTVQELYDAVISEEGVIEAIAEMMELDPEELSYLSDIVVSDYVEEYSDVTIDALLDMIIKEMTGETAEEPIYTVESLVTYAAAMMKAPVGELFPGIASAIELIKTFNISDLYYKVVIGTGANGEFNALTLEEKVAFSGTGVYYDYDDTGSVCGVYSAKSSMMMEVIFKIESISDEITVIALPEGATVVQNG